ncbi:hypothetical protein PG996_006298 [Apiospora saccharicola]|uniref:Uncharacterized protein n=1 Tax=Apiospora saccharicola TaxID=335842 RepID=A0ABR1VRZ0_9PEZI
MCTVIIDRYRCKHCGRAVWPATFREPSWVACREKDNYSQHCVNYDPTFSDHYEHECIPGSNRCKGGSSKSGGGGGSSSKSKSGGGGSSGDFSFAQMHYSARK